jgi:hypothetical protein
MNYGRPTITFIAPLGVDILVHLLNRSLNRFLGAIAPDHPSGASCFGTLLPSARMRSVSHLFYALGRGKTNTVIPNRLSKISAIPMFATFPYRA